MVKYLAGVAEFTAAVQFGHDLRKPPLLALVVDDPLRISTHQEEPSLAMPASVVSHAIGLGIDDVQQGLTQLLALHIPHHRVEGIQWRGRRQPTCRAAAVEALGVPQLHGHGGNRCAALVRDDQSRHQLVPGVILARELEAVSLAVVMPVVEVRPVMDNQSIVLAIRGDGHSRGVNQRLSELRQCDTWIGVEPSGGLGSGERLRRRRQYPQSSCNPLKRSQVFLDQLAITPLEACIVGRQRSDILILYGSAV